MYIYVYVHVNICIYICTYIYIYIYIHIYIYRKMYIGTYIGVSCKILQSCVTRCCGFSLAMHCNILQHTASYCHTLQHTAIHKNVTGWLRLVGSLKSQVSFAKEPCKRDFILQNRPVILRSLRIVATPYTLTLELGCDLARRATAALHWRCTPTNKSDQHIYIYIYIYIY